MELFFVYTLYIFDNFNYYFFRNNSLHKNSYMDMDMDMDMEMDMDMDMDMNAIRLI